MIVRMVHPEHGATHVYDQGEMARLQGLGWSVEGEPRCKPSTFTEHIDTTGKEPATVISVVDDPAQIPARKKPGPKPKAK